MNTKISGFGLLLIQAILLWSCGSIKPETPETTVTNTPIHFNPVNNQVVVPIEMDLSSYYVLADKQIPAVTTGADNPCNGIRYQYEFTKESFRIQGQAKQLLSELNGSYWIKMEYCAGCSKLFTQEPVCMTPVIPFSCGINETKPALKIQLATELGINRNYGIEAKTNIVDLVPINPCEVTLFRFDATKEVLKEVRKTVEMQCKALDKQLSSMHFRSEVNEIWKNINQTIAIPSLGYLHFTPTSLALVEPQFEKNNLKTTLVINCNTYLNQEATPTTRVALPELTTITKAPKDTFNVITSIQLDYDSLSMLFTEQIKGQKLEFKENTFVFEQVNINGLNNKQLLIGIQFSGTKKGTLYLQGIPHFNNETKVFSLEQVDFDIKTKNLLIKTASWLFSNKISQELKKATQISLKAECDSIKTLINTYLNQHFGDFILEGKAIDVAVQDLFIQKEHVLLNAGISALMKIKNR